MARVYRWPSKDTSIVSDDALLREGLMFSVEFVFSRQQTFVVKLIVVVHRNFENNSPCSPGKSSKLWCFLWLLVLKIRIKAYLFRVLIACEWGHLRGCDAAF